MRGELFLLYGREDWADRDFQAVIRRSRQKRVLFDILFAKARIFSRGSHPEKSVAIIDELLNSSYSKVLANEASLLEERSEACRRMGRYGEAVRDLRRAMNLFPLEPVIVNNFAWLLCTIKERSFRQPEEALALARKAVALDKGENPCYLDTLAEACYINGLYDDAIKWELLAEEKGAEVYQPVRQRYQKARDEQSAGKRVVVTDSPLVGHRNPPRGDAGKYFDPTTVPAPPRLGPREYDRAIPIPKSKILPDYDTVMKSMAAEWVRTPATIIDNPLVDITVMLARLQQWSLSNRATPAAERQALYDYMRKRSSQHPDSPVDAQVQKPLQTEIERLFIADLTREDTPKRLGTRVAMRLKAFSRDEMANLLKSLATGSFRLSQCFDIAYYVSGNGEPTEQSAIWGRIEKGIVAAAHGTPLPLPKRTEQEPGTRKGIERLRGIPPPPGM